MSTPAPISDAAGDVFSFEQAWSPRTESVEAPGGEVTVLPLSRKAARRLSRMATRRERRERHLLAALSIAVLALAFLVTVLVVMTRSSGSPATTFGALVHP